METTSLNRTANTTDRAYAGVGKSFCQNDSLQSESERRFQALKSAIDEGLASEAVENFDFDEHLRQLKAKQAALEAALDEGLNSDVVDFDPEEFLKKMHAEAVAWEKAVAKGLVSGELTEDFNPECLMELHDEL